MRITIYWKSLDILKNKSSFVFPPSTREAKVRPDRVNLTKRQRSHIDCANERKKEELKMKTKRRSKNQIMLESKGWEKVGMLWLSPYTKVWHNLRTALETEKSNSKK